MCGVALLAALAVLAGAAVCALAFCLIAGHAAEVAAAIGLILGLESLSGVRHALFALAVRAANLRSLVPSACGCGGRPPVLVQGRAAHGVLQEQHLLLDVIADDVTEL